MSKVVNTVIVIIILLTLSGLILYIAIDSTIDRVEYNNIETISLIEFESILLNNEKEPDFRFVRFENVLAYYYYSIKTYNTFTGPNQPTAIYFPIIDPSKVDYRSNLNLFEKFRVVVRDTNYSQDVIEEKKDMTLSVISFNAKILKSIPDIVKSQLYSKDFKKKFDEKLIYIEKDYEPIALWLLIVIYSSVAFIFSLIILILKRGGIEIIKVTRGNVKAKNVKDNIGEI